MQQAETLSGSLYWSVPRILESGLTKCAVAGFKPTNAILLVPCFTYFTLLPEALPERSCAANFLTKTSCLSTRSAILLTTISHWWKKNGSQKFRSCPDKFGVDIFDQFSAKFVSLCFASKVKVKALICRQKSFCWVSLSTSFALQLPSKMKSSTCFSK